MRGSSITRSGLIFILRFIVASAAQSDSLAASSAAGLGPLILQGLGGTSTTGDSSAAATQSSSYINALPSTASSTTRASDSTVFTDYTPSWQGSNTHSTLEPVEWLGNSPDISSARSCWSALTSWEYEVSSYFVQSVLYSTWPLITTTLLATTDTVFTTATIYPSDVSTYKLCDGVPRVNATPTTVTSVGTVITYGATVTTEALYPTYSAPLPCNASAETCYNWFRYSNLTKGISEVGSSDSPNNANLLYSQCGLPPHFVSTQDNSTHWPCLIVGGPVQLFYFPVDTGNQSICNASRTAIVSSRTTPAPTVVTDGHTFTSGSVYLSFQTLHAYYDPFDISVGTSFSDFYMTLASTDISTTYGVQQTSGLSDRMNYADLNFPVPASAYSRANTQCEWDINTSGAGAEGCSTIWDDFDPLIAIPTQVLDLDPAWKTCMFYDEIVTQWLFDPPIALTQASSAAVPTLSDASVSVQSTPAPSVTPISPYVHETSRQLTAASDILPTRYASSDVNDGQSSQTTDHASTTQLDPGLPTATGAAGVFTLDSLRVTVSLVSGHADELVVDGTTLLPDGSALVVDHLTISNEDGSLVEIKTSTGGSSSASTRTTRSEVTGKATSSSTTSSAAAAAANHLHPPVRASLALNALIFTMGVLILMEL